MCIISGIIALASAVGITTATVASTATAVGLSTTAFVVGDIVATVAITGAVVGGTLGTVGAINQAEAAQAQANYQAEIEAENARLAKTEAEKIELQGNQERNQLRLKALTALSTSRANFAARGVVLGAGTANDMEADIMDAYDLDKRNLNYDIASRAWQKQVEAVNHTNQSNLYKAQAAAYGQQKKSALISGIIDTTSSAISAGASGFSMGSKLGDSLSGMDFSGITSIFSAKKSDPVTDLTMGLN